jgi:hypothetical protein
MPGWLFQQAHTGSAFRSAQFQSQSCNVNTVAKSALITANFPNDTASTAPVARPAPAALIFGLTPHLESVSEEDASVSPLPAHRCCRSNRRGFVGVASTPSLEFAMRTMVMCPISFSNIHSRKRSNSTLWRLSGSRRKLVSK